MTILGSDTPALEYSLSMCDVGSRKHGELGTFVGQYSDLRTLLGFIKSQILPQSFCILLELCRQASSTRQGIL